MKATQDNKNLVRVPRAALLALVASKLKGRVLFPEKVEAAKEYISKAVFKTA